MAVSVLGLTQILAWGSTYYLPAVLAKPIADDTGWPLAWVVGGLSVGLLVAGLVSPRVGAAIERWGGRPILALGAAVLSAGLAGLALAPNLATFIAAWIVIGAGMGAGLYDAAFATLGRLYGHTARSAITMLTLFGGFASTVCWPLSAVLVSSFGWRGTCLAYAALHLGIVLPLYVLALPREAERRAGGVRPDPSGIDPPRVSSSRERLIVFASLAAALTLAAVISSVLSVHLLTVLQQREATLAAAVALGALVGPSQVGARAIEMAIGHRFHPILTLFAAVLLVAGGLVVLASGFPLGAAGLILYGAGLGITSIVRGTLPLALFGASGYAALMGQLALPSLVAQALSPLAGAFILERGGASILLWTLVGLALLNVGLALVLHRVSRRLRGGT